VLWQWMCMRPRFNHLPNRFEGNALTYSETRLLLIYGRASGDYELREYEEMKVHDVGRGCCFGTCIVSLSVL